MREMRKAGRFRGPNPRRASDQTEPCARWTCSILDQNGWPTLPESCSGGGTAWSWSEHGGKTLVSLGSAVLGMLSSGLDRPSPAEPIGERPPSKTRPRRASPPSSSHPTCKLKQLEHTNTNLFRVGLLRTTNNFALKTSMKVPR